MQISEPAVGVVLSGGRSSCMGDGDKCLLQLGCQQVLARIVDRLKPQVTEVIINANEDPLRFADFGLPVMADSIVVRVGPLAGVHAGLEWVKANAPDVRYIATVASDTPFFPVNLVQSFLSEAGDYPAFLVASSSEGVHPVVGPWPVAMVPQIENVLRLGMLRVGAFTKEHSATEVFFAPIRIGARLVDPFYNINRPEDLGCVDAPLREAP